MMHGYGAGWMAWPLMALVMLILWGGLIAAIVWFLAQRRNKSTAPTPNAASPANATSAAIEILDQRYARGEIDEDQWRSARDNLRGAVQ